MVRELTPPAFRRLRVYAFDPSASTDLRTATMNAAVIKVPWEELDPGPRGEYLEVIDVDPASDAFYEPVNLNSPQLLAQDGHAPSEGNPQFHQQMVYAVGMTTIRNFERALGRRVLWAWRWARRDDADAYRSRTYIGKLRIYPHALREANAYYSPQKRALLFGYFRASGEDVGTNLPGGMIFSCLSHDIIAHEMSHAILDGMHRMYLEPSNPDSLAFHEAFADVVALLQHFTMPEAVKNQIGRLRGDLSQRSLLSNLALQFGQAIGNYGALRDGIDKIDPVTGLPDARAIGHVTEPHERGAILVAAVFDAFLTIYRTRVADLIRMVTGEGERYPDRDLHPDLLNRLTAEANKTAGHVLRMCIRALDYLPPVDVTFGDFLRAVVTADSDLVADDDRGYRIAFVESFRRRGIYPRDCRSLAVDSLLWGEPDEDVALGWLDGIDTSHKESREDLWKQAIDNAGAFYGRLKDRSRLPAETLRKMGLALDDDAPKTIRRSIKDGGAPAFDVQSVRTTRRIGPDGEELPQLVVEIVQERRGFSDAGEQANADASGHRSRGADFTFRGGCTLIIDLHSARVRYIVSKDILSASRLEAQRRFLFERETESLGATYFGLDSREEPFAFLHRNG
ncbi:hypothetical protein [Bradyrhizobium sp. CCGUVB14]|uniref:hypothetical protein n=1 Tax=Bradyrhizobium sp. CCGUVB14 TaxID=2949628 RepID=UPI0020B37B05|nr:hypothetical protein [Bradyrhizobium sp. CCGUVB14]MCP3447201.1 hypothetical protein [Bradyrhizobium sp. CCGUVB14]